MNRPKLLDLFCGAGGAARGYQLAGFDVTGVDHRKQPRYAGDRFIQADALEFLADADLTRYNAIHASPPCQAYSRLRHLPWLRDREYPLLIEPTRVLLLTAGLPFVIENVEDAPLMKAPGLFGLHGVVLCGQMFGLPIYRHRPFESNIILATLPHPHHTKQGRGRRLNQRRSQRTEILTIAGHSTGWPLADQQAAMGIDWMNRDELAQAIPPAYTRHIGQLLVDNFVDSRNLVCGNETGPRVVADRLCDRRRIRDATGDGAATNQGWMAAANPDRGLVARGH